MTYYNINRLEALKGEYAATRETSGEMMYAHESVQSFINFLKEKEKASFFDPNQLEIPFPDEDNSK